MQSAVYVLSHKIKLTPESRPFLTGKPLSDKDISISKRVRKVNSLKGIWEKLPYFDYHSEFF